MKKGRLPFSLMREIPAIRDVDPRALIRERSEVRLAGLDLIGGRLYVEAAR